MCLLSTFRAMCMNSFLLCKFFPNVQTFRASKPPCHSLARLLLLNPWPKPKRPMPLRRRPTRDVEVLRLLPVLLQVLLMTCPFFWSIRFAWELHWLTRWKVQCQLRMWWSSLVAMLTRRLCRRLCRIGRTASRSGLVDKLLLRILWVKALVSPQYFP